MVMLILNSSLPMSKWRRKSKMIQTLKFHSISTMNNRDKRNKDYREFMLTSECIHFIFIFLMEDIWRHFSKLGYRKLENISKVRSLTIVESRRQDMYSEGQPMMMDSWHPDLRRKGLSHCQKKIRTTSTSGMTTMW